MRAPCSFGIAALSAALFVLAVASSPASATITWTVGAGANCDAHTIQDAVNLAAQSQTTDAKLIEIASDQDYSAQAIHVDNQSLGFVGGPISCHSSFTSDAPIISGDGASGSVFSITGTGDIGFYHLEIRDGNATTGGGISFTGNGSLSITDVLLDFNAATYGGGLAAHSDGSLNVYLNVETLILRNTAENSGGGVELSGNVHFYALAADILIGYNDVSIGTGGGIDAVAPTTINLGSPGYHGLPVVFDNTAAYGGGIAMSGDGNFDHFGGVQLFAMDPQNPVSVSDNGASVAGGGIYLKTLTNSAFPTAEVCAQDFRINENFAPEGAAIYLDWDTIAFTYDVGSGAFLNPHDQSCDQESLGAVHCAAGVDCNEMSGNVSADINGHPANGAIVLVGTSSLLSAERTAMQHNVADNLIRTVGNNDHPAGVLLRSCLTGANQFAREMIHMQNDDNTLIIDQCTFAPDIINAAHVIAFDNAGGNNITMINTIVDEPGTLTLAQPGIDQSIENILTNDDSTLPSHVDIILGTPDFVDAANGNYRQLPSSLGVDFAIATGGIDLDGNARDVDLPDTPNFFGPRDLGAYETQRTFACSVADTIYCDGFDGP